MQKAKFCYFLSFLLLVCFPLSAGNVHPIIPHPLYVMEKEGQFVIDGRTSIVIEAPDAEYHRTAGFLTERFRAAAGFDIKIIAGNA
ncbi:MAG: glycoside hydrolase family 20 zincin-like fold domain-containing protein, partial [Prolixibacteraceae bacterium]|nr:glycoside hydrolase family 20 zincin-like fold domain-containing protein [Prolixibacteraceae bacterium]